MARPDIYTYTASANPFFVKSLAHKFGYEFDADQPLNTVLQQIVAQEGESALFEIIENNPDKELFMDYFKIKYGVKPDNCTCGTGSNATKDILAASYMNFSGAIASQQIAENKNVTNETKLLVYGGIFLLSLVIIFKKL